VQKSIYAEDYRAAVAWLRDRRKESGLTMREVGKRLGVHHSWIGKVEIGERRLDVAEYVRLCRAIGAEAGQGIAVIEATLGPYAEKSSPRLKAAEPMAKYPAQD